MDVGGSTQEDDLEHEQDGLDFLDFPNGSAAAQPEGNGNGISTNSNANGEQFNIDEVLERELVAILTQAAHGASQSTNNTGGLASSESIPPKATSSDIQRHLSQATPNEHVQPHEQYLSGLAAVLQATPNEHVQPHEQYLSGLAAVLQAAQAMQPQSSNAGATQELAQAGQAEGANTVNGSEFSELLAHLTAQLEQGLQQQQQQQSLLQPQPGIEGPSQVAQPEVVAGPRETSVPAENFSLFSPTGLLAPLSTAIPSPPPPPSGQIPYYSGVFGTSFQQSQFQSQTPGAGPSTPVSNSQIDSASSKAAKGKGKAKRTDGSERPRKSFSCAMCDKSFGRKSDMLRHMRIHTGDRPFVCPHEGCGRTFIQRSALHVHLRVHSGEKPHMCEYPLCGRTFSDSSSLARHRRTHTGKRPYACKWPDCTKMFTRRTALTQHMRTHDPNWEPDPNIRYSFKPKKRKIDGKEEDEDEEDEDEEENAIDPALEESIRTLSNILAQSQPDQNQNASQAISQTANGSHLASNVDSKSTGEASENPQLVAAISAEIAAAIAQAQAQIQAEMFNEDIESDDDEEGSENEGEDAVRVDSLGMNVSGIRCEQPAPPPPPQPLETTTVPVPTDLTAPDTFTTGPASSPATSAVPTTSGADVGEERNDQGDEEEDFPVPLRERRPKPSKSKPRATSISTSLTRNTNKRKR